MEGPMIIHKTSFFSVYFGDAQSSLPRDFLMTPCRKEELWQEKSLGAIKLQLQLEDLIFLKQIHSTLGEVVSDETLSTLMHHKPEGDFLITKRAQTGLGVYTADCLPIVVYDKAHNVMGMCHAGWMGTVHKVVVHMLQRMQKEYGTDLEQIQILFGPSAQSCCYEVQEDFRGHLKDFSFQERVLQERAGKLYFDIPLCNKLQLLECGVKPEQCDFSHNTCTICVDGFCSNRRNRESMNRQITVAVLNRKI